jgi:hypothetical protein
MARELEPGRKLARHRGSFLEGPTGSPRARQQGLSGGVHGQLDQEYAARQAHGRARLSFDKEGRAFTRLARSRPAARRAPTRPSFFRLDRSGGDGFGAGPALAFKGAEEFAPPAPDNAPYTKLVLSVAALAEPRLPGAGGRASRPHPLVRKGRAGAQLQARRG